LGGGWTALFAVLSIAAAIAIIYWLFVRGAALDWLLTVALGAVTGGILGNLYDRLALHGLVWPPPDPRAGRPVHAVRDWILVQASDQWRWPNFNVADSMLVCGAALLMWHMTRRSKASLPGP